MSKKMRRAVSVVDRFLEVFVPKTSAQAADCWYEHRCDAGRISRRQCCMISGLPRCGSWQYVGYGC